MSTWLLIRPASTSVGMSSNCLSIKACQEKEETLARFDQATNYSEDKGHSRKKRVHLTEEEEISLKDFYIDKTI